MSGRIRSVTPKDGYVFDGRDVIPARDNVVAIRDGLANVLTGRGTSVDRSMHGFWHFMPMSAQQIEAAYRGNWLHRKIVDIPAEDMTRAGRDWDAEADEIEKIEADEKRLGLWQKLHAALTLGRLGGGAIVVGLRDGRPEMPLPSSVGVGDLQYLVVLSRWQLRLGDMVTDPASPMFGEPAYFEINGASGQPRIHPSRVITFKGLPVPYLGMSASWEDRYWGDSVVQAVDEAVKQATMASAGFASLIEEAKVDIYRFDKLLDQLLQPDGDARINRRIELTNTGKSVHRAVILDKEDEWEQRQLNWAGIRDVIVTYDARVAGAADIPATRLFGKAPDGQNSTGESDLVNYFQSIGAKQEADLRPQIARVDDLLLPSAGVSLGLSWAFSPLRVLTEQQQAEVENKEADSVSKYVNLGLFPESAIAKVVANRLTESQRWPGLADAIEEAEAAGEEPPDDDPSAIVPVNPEAPGNLPESS